MAKSSLPPQQENGVVRVVGTYPKAGLHIYEIVKGLLQSPEPEAVEDWDLAFQVASTVVSVGGESNPKVPDGRALYRWHFEDGELFPQRLMALASFITDLVDDGETVLIHCAAGVNRSGLVSALVVRELTGCSGLSARIQVQTMRPGALINPTYRKFLDDLPMLEAAIEVEVEKKITAETTTLLGGNDGEKSAPN